MFTTSLTLCTNLLKRYQPVRYALITTLLVITSSPRAKAAGIFSSAQNAMTCIINSAGSGGATNTIITKLPTIIFTAVALFLFAYFLGSTFQLVQAVRAGEEVSQLVIPMLAAIIGVIVITVFQNILFGSGGC
jgi:hypothetical protein